VSVGSINGLPRRRILGNLTVFSGQWEKDLHTSDEDV
jgi:hypothetical protein